MQRIIVKRVLVRQHSKRCLSTSNSALRVAILNNAVEKQVAKYGWTVEALVEASADLSPTSSLSISGLVTPNDLIRHAMTTWNRQLQQELRERTWKLDDARIDRMAWAVQRRLEFIQPLVESWPAGMALGAHPDNMATTKEQLQKLISMIVTETSHPSDAVLSELQQLTLGAIYVATELHLLTDRSPEHRDTWGFLRQRLEEWEMYQMSLFSIPTDSLYVASAVGSAFVSGTLSLLGSGFKLPPPSPLAASGVPDFSRAPDDLWNAVFGSPEERDGTRASHYEATSAKKAETKV